MDFKTFTYIVQAEVEFTRLELSELVQLSADHYDGLCRAASEVGGFLHGYVMQLFDKESAVITVTSREIDMLCKIAEGETMFCLGFKLTQIHRKITEESRRINNEIEWLPTL
jgi:hypothetical protein